MLRWITSGLRHGGRAVTTITAAAALSLAALLAPATAWAQQGPQDYGYSMMGGWGGWFLGPIMMIVFIAIAVVVVVLLVRWLGGTGQAPHAHHSPGRTSLDILKERYARGEIDKDEFEERRRVLGE